MLRTRVITGSILGGLLLLGLFLLQRRGSERIGTYFGPVMAVWFLALALAGLMQIIQAPYVLAALNPVQALAFFGHHGVPGFFVLGSVFLALTGAGRALQHQIGSRHARGVFRRCGSWPRASPIRCWGSSSSPRWRRPFWARR